MKRLAGVMLVVSQSVFAAGVAPCTDGAAGETILPIRTLQTTYCVSDFGWSDTWFRGSVATYNQQRDVFSGEDSFNLRWAGMTGQGWLSPSMDNGTTVPRPVTSQWGILTAVQYTVPGLETQVQSVIGHADGLRATITTTVDRALVTIHFRILNTSTTRSFDNLVLSDYFNFHPNGSLHGNNSTRQGTTSYLTSCPVALGTCNGVLYTTGNTSLSTFIANGFVYGQRAPDAYAIGYASGMPTGTQALFTQIGNNTWNMLAGPLGPQDTAGGLAYNLGNLAPGQEVDFTFYKGLEEVPEPGTWAMLAAGIVLIFAGKRRARSSASAWTSSRIASETPRNRQNG